ncbi:MAG: hypothetical protein MJ188_05940 [Treponema sp.]|nr:hypothetical protein [Treponema sp.]
MKRNNLFLIITSFFLTIIFSACLLGPQDTEETYTVWTESVTYSEFSSIFGDILNDGMYIKLEFDSYDWEKISSSLSTEEYHIWSKEIIKTWLIGRGFGDYESTKESSWFATIEHGFLASRTGDTVYMIVK